MQSFDSFDSYDDDDQESLYIPMQGDGANNYVNNPPMRPPKPNRLVSKAFARGQYPIPIVKRTIFFRKNV